MIGPSCPPQSATCPIADTKMAGDALPQCPQISLENTPQQLHASDCGVLPSSADNYSFPVHTAL